MNDKQSLNTIYNYLADALKDIISIGSELESIHVYADSPYFEMAQDSLMEALKTTLGIRQTKMCDIPAIQPYNVYVSSINEEVCMSEDVFCDLIYNLHRLEDARLLDRQDLWKAFRKGDPSSLVKIESGLNQLS